MLPFRRVCYVLLILAVIVSPKFTYAQLSTWGANHKYPRVAVDWLVNDRTYFSNPSSYPGKTNLNILSTFHVAILQIDAQSQTWSVDVSGSPQNVLSRLKTLNNSLKNIAYYWGTFSEIDQNQWSSANHPFKNATMIEVSKPTNDWWYYTLNKNTTIGGRIYAPGSPCVPPDTILQGCNPNPNGTGKPYFYLNISDITQTPGQGLYNDWIADYLKQNIDTAKFDGLMFDNADLHPCWILSPSTDWNKNNILDSTETNINGSIGNPSQGHIWSDLQFSQGISKIYSFLRNNLSNSFILGGNNSWYSENFKNPPNPTDPYFSPYNNIMDFVRSEAWPSAPAYTAESPTSCIVGRPNIPGVSNAAQEDWNFGMRSYLYWNKNDKIFFLGLSDLSNGGYDQSRDPWGSIDLYQSLRYQITSALMGDGYVNLGQTDPSLKYYDYFAVNLTNGRAEPLPQNLGYLGIPVDDSSTIDPQTGNKIGKLTDLVNDINYDISQHVYRRDFTNGIAIVNPSGNSVSVNLENTVEYRKIQGYDPGNCQLSDCTLSGNTIQLAPYDGIILLNAPGIINQPLLTPTLVPNLSATPESTSSATPGLDFGSPIGLLLVISLIIILDFFVKPEKII